MSPEVHNSGSGHPSSGFEIKSSGHNAPTSGYETTVAPPPHQLPYFQTVSTTVKPKKKLTFSFATASYQPTSTEKPFRFEESKSEKPFRFPG